MPVAPTVTPAADVYETGDELVVELEAPLVADGEHVHAEERTACSRCMCRTWRLKPRTLTITEK
jgi:hypothetical protein